MYEQHSSREKRAGTTEEIFLRFCRSAGENQEDSHMSRTTTNIRMYWQHIGALCLVLTIDQVQRYINNLFIWLQSGNKQKQYNTNCAVYILERLANNTFMDLLLFMIDRSSQEGFPYSYSLC